LRTKSKDKKTMNEEQSQEPKAKLATAELGPRTP